MDDKERCEAIRGAVWGTYKRTFPTGQITAERLKRVAKEVVPEYLDYEIVETIGGVVDIVFTVERSR